MINISGDNTNSLARALSASHFENRILNNANLSLSEIVQIVYEGSLELAGNIFCNISVLKGDANLLAVAADNLLKFMNWLVLENEIENKLLEQIIYQNYTISRHFR